jgi:hypothetical protein
VLYAFDLLVLENKMRVRTGASSFARSFTPYPMRLWRPSICRFEKWSVRYETTSSSFQLRVAALAEGLTPEELECSHTRKFARSAVRVTLTSVYDSAAKPHSNSDFYAGNSAWEHNDL